MAVLVKAPPCVIHEDEHLLVVVKPPGLNTHSPSPFAGEGIYDWLRNREPRWASLAIIHRLDKATSGVMVFAKTTLANRSLTQQFSERKVRKRYLLLTDRSHERTALAIKTGLRRMGERYFAEPPGRPGSDLAETKFQWREEFRGFQLWSAEPLTGKTHQIRVHAQSSSFPILGDTLYGGSMFQRVCLHAEYLSFEHPATGQKVEFQSASDFFESPAKALRSAIIEPDLTDAYRIINGAADLQEGLYVDRWGPYILASSESQLSGQQTDLVRALAADRHGAYFKKLERNIRRTTPAEAGAELLFGAAAPNPFLISENGVKFEISFEHGYSAGLFLDQRDNRRRLLTNYAAPGFELFPNGLKRKEVLNTFAYTCGFSVCAALAGASTTSLDLSKKYLEWGKRNFAANGLDPSQHDFIYGDVFDWAGRLARKGRVFDLVLLDPPTFSHAKSGGTFQAEKDYGKLVEKVLPLLKPGGILFASTNARNLAPEDFIAQIRAAAMRLGRRDTQMHFVPQPIDFPISRGEPAYLKTVWLRLWPSQS
jgi:23S rRNA (cytosine1962-C5)-methyltransferase